MNFNLEGMPICISLVCQSEMLRNPIVFMWTKWNGEGALNFSHWSWCGTKTCIDTEHKEADSSKCKFSNHPNGLKSMQNFGWREVASGFGERTVVSPGRSTCPLSLLTVSSSNTPDLSTSGLLPDYIYGNFKFILAPIKSPGQQFQGNGKCSAAEKERWSFLTELHVGNLFVPLVDVHSALLQNWPPHCRYLLAPGICVFTRHKISFSGTGR